MWIYEIKRAQRRSAPTSSRELETTFRTLRWLSMGDGTTDDLYIDPEDDDSGSPSGDEAPDIDPDQTGVDEYTDESPSEEAPSEDSGPSPETTPSGTDGNRSSGGGGGGGIIGIPEGVEEGDDSPGEAEKTPILQSREVTGSRRLQTKNRNKRSRKTRMITTMKKNKNRRSCNTRTRGITWGGGYPIILKIKERYGHEVDTDYHLVPVREFVDPEEMASKWERPSSPQNAYRYLRVEGESAGINRTRKSRLPGSNAPKGQTPPNDTFDGFGRPLWLKGQTSRIRRSFSN